MPLGGFPDDGTFGNVPRKWVTISGGTFSPGATTQTIDYAALFGGPNFPTLPTRYAGISTLGFGVAYHQVIDYKALFASGALGKTDAEQGVPFQTPTGIPPQFQFVFDTIGQTIIRSIGHCRLPLRIIWAQGIEASGDTTTSSTISFAAALCAPIDPEETGSVVGLSAGGSVLYDSGGGGIIVPDGMTPETAALLTAAINNIVIYPGDEAQEPAPLIVADKGADKTNAFRGIRYIIFPGWPLDAGIPSNLSIQWQRTNNITLNSTYTPSGAVEFVA